MSAEAGQNGAEAGQNGAEAGQNGSGLLPDPEEGKLRLGGMALRNGLLVHGPTHWAAAVRTPAGEIEVASGPKPTVGGPLESVPGLRGVLKLGEAFLVIPLVKTNLPAARLPFEDGRVLAAMAASVLAGGALRRSGRRTVVGEALVAVLGVAPALVALRGSELAAYHGVEHKAIAAYEQDSDAADAAKEHERCGSNLVAPMLATSVIGNLLMRRLVERPGPLAQAAVGLGSMAVAVELFAWTERNPESRLAQALKRPGNEMQRLFATREPTPEQLEVGRAALDEILRVEAA